MRWRIKGINWEERDFIVSAGLVVLLKQIDALDPVRRPGDGTVASETHDSVSPNSDHRPVPYVGPGVVRAADIGEKEDAWADKLVQAILDSRDPRIKYVISDGRSCWSVPRNGYQAWEWQPYHGANDHEKHMHISVLPKADTDLRSWDLSAMAPAPPMEDTVLPITPESSSEDIRFAQSLLNEGFEAGIEETGVYDAATVAAVKQYTGSSTGNPDWAAGKGIGSNQWTVMWKAWLAEIGVTPAPVDSYTKAESDARYTKKGSTVTSTGKTT